MQLKKKTKNQQTLSIPSTTAGKCHFKGNKPGSVFFLKTKASYWISNPSVTMQKYTHSNVVSEHISDFSCLSLWSKPPVLSVELLWANLCIKYDHRTFRVWCWVLVVPLEQKWLWPKWKKWRVTVWVTAFPHSMQNALFFPVSSFFTEYICWAIPTYYIKAGSMWCTLLKALWKMNIWKETSD